MSKTNIAMAALLAVLVLYCASLIRSDVEAAEGRISSSSATIYESCQTRNATITELGLDAEQDDCAVLLTQEN